MKTLIVNRSRLSHEIQVPSSKSQTHRAILLASLAQGFSKIWNPLYSSDSLSMIEACRSLGAKIEMHENFLSIEGIQGKVGVAENVIDAHNSGIVLRFVSAIAALGSRPIVITGDHSIRHQRSMQVFMDAFSQLGVRLISTRGDGFAPLIIQGPMQAGHCVIEDGSDSQPVSALLLAAIFLKGTLEIEVRNPGEKPWIDITLDWLTRLGVPFENHNHEKYIVQGIGCYEGFEYHVPGDWSSAAFPLAAALITQSELTIKNVCMEDLQGDKKIIDIFRQMGADFHIDSRQRTIRVAPCDKLKGITVDINHCIDAITIIAAVACYAEGETHITHASVARQKECNRLACTVQELSKMGAMIQETEDGLRIKGNKLKGNTVFSHADHRMAMSLAVAGMGAEGETAIQHSQCIEKTYPSFVKDFQCLGAQIKES